MTSPVRALLSTSHHAPRARAAIAIGNMDTTLAWVCADGKQAPNGFAGHYVWDASTLAGTGQLTVKAGACGNKSDTTSTVNLQLKPA